MSIDQIREPAYYQREYANDFRSDYSEHSWKGQSKRIAAITLPFISLYKPLSPHLSIGLGTLRTLTSASQLYDSIQKNDANEIPYQLFQTLIAAIALSSTILAHPIGMLITTGQDLVIEISNLSKHLSDGEYEKAAESCVKIINQALYLGLFLYGGLELEIAYLALQVLLSLYSSQGEFMKGRQLEGIGHLIMAMVRGNQLAGKIAVFQREPEDTSSVRDPTRSKALLQAAPSERDALLENCRRLAAQGRAQCGGCNCHLPGLYITQYLNSIGTPTALSLLQELSSRNFSC